MDQKPGPVNVR